jgi:hypothetical protein
MAAEQGDSNAQFNLGVMYEFGNGVNQDINRAIGWYYLAAQQGHVEASGVRFTAGVSGWLMRMLFKRKRSYISNKISCRVHIEKIVCSLKGLVLRIFRMKLIANLRSGKTRTIVSIH